MTETIRPRRSALYMPANNDRALEKAKSLAADAIIIDLEDSVAPDGKADARAQAAAAIGAGGYGTREVVLRVNGLATEWGADDFAAAATSGAAAVCVPKVQSAQDVADIRQALTKGGAPAELDIWAMIETPPGVLNAREIAEAAQADANPITVLVMGTNDLAKETRAEQTPDRAPALASLAHAIVVARAYGLDILDGVYNNFRDEDGFRAECTQGREFGMDGKTLIHPAQIGPCNDIFSPDDDTIAWSRQIIAAFEEEQNRGRGVITVDGKMVELLHREIALRTVAIADAIAEAGS